MIPAERQRLIINLLSQSDILSITELTKTLDVSHMTVRRDIETLERKGLVVAVSGGVQLSEALVKEAPHNIKATHSINEKQAIGIYAAQLIPQGASIYLDAGTTTLELAKQLQDRDDLLVITNDFVIANYLIKSSECTLYHTGGKIDRLNQSSVGNKACKIFDDVNIHMAFVSTSSWDMRGISTPSEEKVFVKCKVLECAHKKYLLTDSSKYGKVATFHVVDLTAFDAVITDEKFSEQQVIDFNEQGVSVIRAVQSIALL